MSRFPRLTETFVLYEILAVEELGLHVDVFPLLREKARVVHPEAKKVVDRARYLPFFSWAILLSQLHWLRRSPRRYLTTLGTVVRGTWGSLNFFIGGLAIFPKVAHAARLMQQDGVRHVHCHFANHPALAGFVIKGLTGIPFSFVAHAADLHVDRHMLREKVREADFVVAVSEYNRRLILDECGEQWTGKVRVIHCGTDVGFFRPPSKRDKSGALRILCVGRLAPWKGQTHLIEACRILAARGVSFLCIVVGGSGDAETLRRSIADAGLTSRLELQGWKTREEVAELMRRSDVLVLPSVPMPNGRKEGIPVVLMEAMASGLPVIATDMSGIPELVVDGKTGLLVAAGDPGALADALERLGSEPSLRARLSSAGRDYVETYFNLRRNARDLVSAIATIAGHTPSAVHRGS